MVSASERSSGDIELRDGSIARLKPAQLEDNGLIDEFVKSLSEDTILFRFLDLPLDRNVLLTELVPNATNYVLMAIRDEKVIGHAAYYRSGRGTAEVGIVIRDAFQDKGLGTIMLEKIASAANMDGISVFETIISHDNLRMIKMVEEMGFPISIKREPDLIRIRFPTSIDPVTIEIFKKG